MDEDPFPGYGLQSVQLADQALLNRYLHSLSEPLSDYTFSQLYTWRNSLRILWKEIDGHLCVFANGTGDLTLLLPPIGDGQSDKAMAGAWELMTSYNAAHGVADRSRVEYASEELLARFDRSRLDVQPMGTDYVYDVTRMIDLAGGDLASKRQAKNRFMRNYVHRVETYDAAKHLDGCRKLLDSWKQHQDSQHAADPSTNAVKRQKESLAAGLTLQHAGDLGLKGLVVYVTGSDGVESIRGFTFGEGIGKDQSSITIEKTDLEAKGLAQFIFSEFCRTTWSDRPLVNVGDDWGLETLAWTKMSYRPVKLLQKYALVVKPAVQLAVHGLAPAANAIAAAAEQQAANVVEAATIEAVALEAAKPQAASEPPATVVRSARREDVGAAVNLEQTCFDAHCLTKRQLQYLQQKPTSIFLVAEQQGRVVGQGIALVRHHKRGISGRIYSLAVSHDCRGQKIGQRFMQQIVDSLVDRGVKRVYLEVEKTNTAAINLYERLGFRSIGVLPNYYGAARDGLHMMREVKSAPGLFDTATAA